MKARLTIVFEKEIDNDDMLLMKYAELDKDYATLYEFFDFWDGAPTEQKLGFLKE